MDNPKSKYNKEKLDTKEMVFSSIVFLYIFLPLMLLIYFIVPKNQKSSNDNSKFHILCMGRN